MGRECKFQVQKKNVLDQFVSDDGDKSWMKQKKNIGFTI